ncbi:MAG: methyltransferase [Nocardioides sp.]
MDTVDEVVHLLRGAWVSLALRAACELGVLDALDEPLGLTELAAHTSSDPATLARLLRVLVDLGLLSVDDGRYRATARGEVLSSDHPSGVRNLALMQTALPNLAAWQRLADGVRRGGAVFEDLHQVTYWEWLSAHPEVEALFNASMARRSALQVAAIEAAHDLSTAGLVVDVGGGKGAMLSRLLHSHPTLRGIVADRPEVAADAAEALAEAGLASRARGEPADFFAEVPPGGDVYLLSNVLHDWDDADAVTILRTIHRAMSPDAHLLLVESVLDAPRPHPARAARPAPGGPAHAGHVRRPERTQQEYDALLVAAGFTTSVIAPRRTSGTC